MEQITEPLHIKLVKRMISVVEHLDQYIIINCKDGSFPLNTWLLEQYSGNKFKDSAEINMLDIKIGPAKYVVAYMYTEQFARVPEDLEKQMMIMRVAQMLNVSLVDKFMNGAFSNCTLPNGSAIIDLLKLADANRCIPIIEKIAKKYAKPITCDNNALWIQATTDDDIYWHKDKKIKTGDYTYSPSSSDKSANEAACKDIRYCCVHEKLPKKDTYAIACKDEASGQLIHSSHCCGYKKPRIDKAIFDALSVETRAIFDLALRNELLGA